MVASTPPPPDSSGLRRWFVAGAIIEESGRVLMVENVRRNGSTDWSTPGGVIEHGEEATAGLAREVVEETGLIVDEFVGPLYSVEAIAADMGWHMTVQVYRAVSWRGHVSVGDDPDGIVVNARFLDHDDAAEHLATNARWVREPIMEWLHHRWSDHRAFRYELIGADRATLVVNRQ